MLSSNREEFDVNAAVEKALAEGELDRVGKLVGGRSAPADARALRGIPMNR